MSTSIIEIEALKVEIERLRTRELPAIRRRVEVPFGLFGIGQGSTAPSVVRLGNSLGYGFTIGDDGYLTFEIPDDWDGASTVDFLVHWYINEAYATRSAEVRWTASYSAVNETGIEVIDSPTHTGSLDSSDINIPASAKALLETTMGSIPVANLALHDIVFTKLTRSALVGGTNPVAEPVIVLVEFEYTAKR